MAWRFADLPVRTKFLITLGIPVLGLVLLIGKQVDSSIKRRNVLGYISGQSQNIALLSAAVNEIQKESSLSIALLCKVEVNKNRVLVQQNLADAAIQALNDPALDMPADVPPDNAFLGLEVLRQRVLQGRTTTEETNVEYRRIRLAVLDGLGRVTKLALDAETKDKLYSHLSLLHAKDALVTIRSLLTRAFAGEGLNVRAMGLLNEQIAQYETNVRMFERDAAPDVLELYQKNFQGADVNLLRSMLGSVQEKRTLEGLHIAPVEWWNMGMEAVEKLKVVEDGSIASIKANTARNLRDAEIKLLLVLLSLGGVVAAVTVMAVVVMRGIRDTVNEVTSAASALAIGDVSAHVVVNSNDEVGEMARSFNHMIDHIRSLAVSAEAIGKGNYDTSVTVRSEQDVLGHALARMKDNLKAARLRDEEQNAALTEEKEKLQRANERIRVLIKEIHHRVKNNLQVVASMLRLQSGTIDDHRLQHVFAQSQSRVASMALIHEKLYKGDELAQLDLTLYLKELFAELIQLNKVRETIQYRTTIDPGLSVDLNTMVPLGLVLNELITNSFKHAFNGRNGGQIDLEIHRVEEDAYDLIYKDDGVGIAADKLHGDGSTLGVSLIDSLVEQLNGHLTVESDDRGTRYHIRFRTN